MSKIRAVLLLFVLQRAGCLVGQAANDAHPNGVRTDQPALFAAHQADKPRKPARIRAGNQGPEGEPALPDNAPNPKPVTVADRPDPLSLRRRKLRLRQRP